MNYFILNLSRDVTMIVVYSSIISKVFFVNQQVETKSGATPVVLD